MEQTGEQEEVTQEQPGLPLGIDFGNSKISCAVWDLNKKAPVMVEFNKMTQFPATLYCSSIFDKKESVPNEGSGEENDLCPEIGLDYSEEKETKYYIYDIKKLIGQKNTNQDLENIINEIRYPNSVDDEGNIVCFEEEKVPFQKLAKYFIEKIKTAAEAQFEKEINFCTISVPHGFNYNQRTAIQEAANAEAAKANMEELDRCIGEVNASDAEESLKKEKIAEYEAKKEEFKEQYDAAIEKVNSLCGK